MSNFVTPTGSGTAAGARVDLVTETGKISSGSAMGREEYVWIVLSFLIHPLLFTTVTATTTMTHHPSKKPIEPGDIIMYGHVTHAWFHVAIQTAITLFAIGVITFVVLWERTVYETCKVTAERGVTEALVRRNDYCLADGIHRMERLNRAQSDSCMTATQTINDGVNHALLDCFMSTNLVHIGKCQQFAVCAKVVEWIDVIHSDLYVIIILCIILALYALRRLWVSGSTSVHTAVDITRQFVGNENDGILSHKAYVNRVPNEPTENKPLEDDGIRFRIPFQQQKSEGGDV